jgi:hypothetical protein
MKKIKKEIKNMKDAVIQVLMIKINQEEIIVQGGIKEDDYLILKILYF